MLNQNNYSEQSEYKEQKEQSANDSSPQTQPKKTPSVRRIGTFTMGITLVLVGILLLVFLFLLVQLILTGRKDKWRR